MDHFDGAQFHLILGNHDILSGGAYDHERLHTYNTLRLGPFTLSHFPLDDGDDYYLCGHIHPCVKLRGKARQYMRLPCYYFDEKGGILPAFGAFTGMHPVDPTRHSDIYAIAEGQILKIEL